MENTRQSVNSSAEFATRVEDKIDDEDDGGDDDNCYDPR